MIEIWKLIESIIVAVIIYIMVISLSQLGDILAIFVIWGMYYTIIRKIKGL